VFVMSIVKFSKMKTRSTCSFHGTKLLTPSSFIGNLSLSVSGIDDDVNADANLGNNANADDANID